ncbi:MAG: hypothetical protein Kow0077_22980 [Anaerolineae bacterium]
MPTVYACCDKNRIAHALAHPTINGIRYLEVLDHEGMPPDERQRRLIVNFLRPVGASLTADNFLIEGGERVVNIQVVEATPGGDDHTVILLVDRAGDFSLYTLRLVDALEPTGPPTGFDPRLSEVAFSFKINCLKDFDCVDDIPGLKPVLKEPDISYLAKDFNSFRQLMLDRMAVTLPDWKERSPADFGIAMVEMLAYVGDQLSAFQDAVSTEPYLATARSRISVRRHCRLVDYFMHDGCNARTFVFLQAGSEVEVPRGTQVLTFVPGLPASFTADTEAYRQALESGPVIFETMAEVALFPAHNEMPFYTWGDENCCLPAGTTSATLQGHYPDLGVGTLLLLEEVRGAETGAPADADPTRRHVVRLTDVRLSEDPIGGVFTPGFAPDAAVPLTEIAWDALDALPFALCISAAGQAPIAVARGNIVLADHGLTIRAEDLGDAPRPVLVKPATGGLCDPEDVDDVPPRFRPRLQERPVTQAQPYLEALATIEGDVVAQLVAELDAGTIPALVANALPRKNTPLPPALLTQRAGEAWLVTVGGTRVVVALEAGRLMIYPAMPAASTLLQQDLQQTMPQIHLNEVETRISDGGIENETLWLPARDLINASELTRQFVVEVENDQTAILRFGDNQYGARPAANDNPDTTKTFLATYRVGNGRGGNIGAETLAHLVTPDGTPLPVTFVRNPLPAQGGTEPESIEQARQNAPVAFRTQERAVTPEDYATITARHPLVQRATASFRWTGSWYTVFITVDLVGGKFLSPETEEELRRFIEPYRMAGHDVEFDDRIDVPLEIAMHVCVKKNASRRQVQQALLARFSCNVLPDGTPGVFHPDNFTFGQTVYLSPLYAAASQIEGVASLRITVFQRQGQPATSGLQSGKIALARREIARLDNDPNYPTRGVFTLTLEGGR